MSPRCFISEDRIIIDAFPLPSHLLLLGGLGQARLNTDAEFCSLTLLARLLFKCLEFHGKFSRVKHAKALFDGSVAQVKAALFMNRAECLLAQVRRRRWPGHSFTDLFLRLFLYLIEEDDLLL